MSFRRQWITISYLTLAALPAAAAAPVWKPARQAPPLPAREGRAVPVSTVPALRQAMENARPGDTILVADGTYMLEQPLLFEGKQHVTLRSASGDPAKATLRGAGGWRGPADDYRSIGNEDLLVIQRSEDIIIAHLTFAEVRHYGIKIGIDADRIPPNPSNIHIYDCRFRDIATRAIKGVAMADRKPVVGGSVRFCDFENTRIPDASWGWAIYEGNYVSAIDMMYLKDWTFSDNVFRNFKGATGGARGAIFIWNQSRNITVERNMFIGCDRSIAFGNPSKPTGYEPGTLHVYDGWVRNNFIVMDSIPKGGGSKGIEIVWTDNVRVYHNTIRAADPRYRAIHYFENIHRLHLANNLVRGRIEGEGDVRAEGNVAGGLEGYFVNPVEGDLHLTGRAADALGKGVALAAVTDDFDGEKRGSPPDVGADERSPRVTR
ncbi:MAG TPA: hypothetical protein VFQ79_02145 [Bryobacteraceae bacterium]|nr:hypothetical protein [Bryobacteraceae bacterium]